MVALKKLEGPADAGAASPPAAHPAQVESMDALIREGAGMQASENADADRTNQAHEQAEAQQNQAMAESVMAKVEKMLLKARDMGVRAAHATDTLPRDQAMAIWTDETVKEAAEPLLEVAAQHSEKLNAFMDRFGPVVMLAIAIGPPAWATFEAAKAHKRKTVTVPSREVPAGEGA